MNEIYYGWEKMTDLRRYAVLLFFCLALIIFPGCNDDDSERSIEVPDIGNYTQMSWVEGYDEFHKQISEQYAFGEWKGIDWDALNFVIRPEVVQAMASNNELAYATALLEYARSLPDGHVFAQGRFWENIEQTDVAGSYGFGIMGLDDGRVIAYIVTEGGQADNAGMEVGDEILEWNGVTITNALDHVSILWRRDGKSLATVEHTLLEKYRMLVLDPINTQSEVIFSKQDGSGSVTASLMASDDNGTIYNRTALPWKIDLKNLVQYEVLDSGYGYVRVGALVGDIAPIKFREAMESFMEKNVPGIIVDLRGNAGGDDAMAAKFSGYFYSDTTVYEYVTHYDVVSGKFEFVDAESDGIIREIPVSIQPQMPNYSGPVVALVNPATISSGEGIAMAVKNLPQGHVVAFYGTNGSFGITGGQAILPGDYSIKFPVGRSLDKNKIIQLDSRNGLGGVTPDIRIPMTAENAVRIGAGEDLELEYAVNILGQM